MLAAGNKNLGRTLLLVCYLLLIMSALGALIAGNSLGALLAAMVLLAAAGAVCIFAVQVSPQVPEKARKLTTMLAVALILAGALVAMFAGSPSGMPRVLQVTPVDGANRTGAESWITVKFSLPMDHDSIRSAVRISPAPGAGIDYIWKDGENDQVLVLKPKLLPGDQESKAYWLAYNTSFTLAIDTAAKSKGGVGLQYPHKSSFMTGGAPPPPTVSKSDPGPGAFRVSKTGTIRISFSRAMDKVATTPVVTISPPVDLNHTWINSDTTLVSRLESDLTPGATYSVKVGADAKSKSGQSMTADHVFSFTVEPPPAAPPSVRLASPSDGSTFVAAGSNITVGFDRDMNTSSAEAAFSATPALVGASFAWNQVNDTMTVGAANTLSPNTTYTVAIAATATSEDGVPMGAPFAFSFTTEAIADEQPPLILHSRVWEGIVGQPMPVVARVLDKSPLARVTLFYRPAGETSWTEERMQSSATSWSFTIPKELVKGPEIEYYIAAIDSGGNSATDPPGGGSAPHKVPIKTLPTPPKPTLKPDAFGWLVGAVFGWTVGAISIAIVAAGTRSSGGPDPTLPTFGGLFAGAAALMNAGMLAASGPLMGGVAAMQALAGALFLVGGLTPWLAGMIAAKRKERSSGTVPVHAASSGPSALPTPPVPPPAPPPPA